MYEITETDICAVNECVLTYNTQSHDPYESVEKIGLVPKALHGDFLTMPYDVYKDPKYHKVKGLIDVMFFNLITSLELKLSRVIADTYNMEGLKEESLIAVLDTLNRWRISDYHIVLSG